MDAWIFIDTFVDPSRVFLSPSGKNKSSITRVNRASISIIEDTIKTR